MALFILVPEVTEAFGVSDAEFKTKYGFDKPDKNSENLVIGCLGGKRALAAQEQLVKLGFNNTR